MNQILRIAAPLFALLSLAPSLCAQVAVQARINPPVIGVGDHATLSLRVQGLQSVETHPQITVEGLEIQQAGTSMQQFSNGTQVTAIISYSYLVTSDKVGDYTIPAVEVTVNGQTYKSDPIAFKVTAGSPIPEEYQPIAELSVGNKKEFYESEVVPISITLLMHPNTTPTELPFPQLPRENFTLKRFERRPEFNQTPRNNVYYRTYTYQSTITAMKAGEFTLGPAEFKVETAVPDGSGIRDPFGGMRMLQRTFRVKSDPLKLTVKPLPAEGKPASFTGAVGNYQIATGVGSELRSQQVKVTVGDPIMVTIQVQGTGNFESLEAPELETLDSWKTYKTTKIIENRSQGLEPGHVAYSQVVIPEKEVKEIPAYVLSYFDPATGTYQTAKSQPIPIQVAPSPNAPAPEVTQKGPTDFGNTEKNPPLEDMQGVLGVRHQSGRWNDLAAAMTLSPFPAWQRWMLHGIPAALLVLILGAGAASRWKRARVNRPRRSEAPPRAADLFRNLRGEHSSVRKFYSLASEFLSAWQSERKKSLPADGPAGEAVRRVHMRRDFYCYGSSEADQPVPASEHAEIVDALKHF